MRPPPPSHSGQRLGSSVSFQLFFKTKTSMMTRAVQICVCPGRECLVEDRGGTELYQLPQASRNISMNKLGRLEMEELCLLLTAGPPLCCLLSEPVAEQAPWPVPNSSVKGAGKQLSSRVLALSPPRLGLERAASGTLAFQGCSKTFPAVNGLGRRHLCPPLPQLLLAHAAGQLVKGGLVLLVEGPYVHVVLAQSSHCQE